MAPRVVRLVVACAALAALAGCTHAKPETCPDAAALAAASSMTVFKNGTVADPANVRYTVDITNVTTTCDMDPKSESRVVEGAVEITFRATRAPTGDAEEHTVPYFIAVTQGDRIISKKVYSASFSFAPGQAVATFTEDVGGLSFTADNDKMAVAYEFLAGLQLTKAQYDYNEAMERFAP